MMSSTRSTLSCHIFILLAIFRHYFLYCATYICIEIYIEKVWEVKDHMGIIIPVHTLKVPFFLGFIFALVTLEFLLHVVSGNVRLQFTFLPIAGATLITDIRTDSLVDLVDVFLQIPGRLTT